MEINYEMIIKYLSPSKAVKKSKTEIKSFDKYDLDKFRYLYFNTDSNLIDSMIYLLSNDNFYINQTKMVESRNMFLKQLKIDENDNNLIKKICNYFNINVLVLSDEIYLYSGKSIIDLSLPFILIYSKDDTYYPVFKEHKKIFFYQNFEIESLLDRDFKVNFENYQFLDDLKQIINKILENEKIETTDECTKAEQIFTSNSKVEEYEQLKKKTKKDLINEILEKKGYDSKKSSLNKMKKNDLINLLVRL